MPASPQDREVSAGKSPTPTYAGPEQQHLADRAGQQSNQPDQGAFHERSLSADDALRSNQGMNQDIGFLSPIRPVDASHLSPYAHLSDHLSEGVYDSFSDYTTPGFGDDLSDIALSSMLSLDDNEGATFATETYHAGSSPESTSKQGSSSVGDSVTHPDTRLLSPAPTNPSISRTNTLNVATAESMASPQDVTSQLRSSAQDEESDPVIALQGVVQHGAPHHDVQADCQGSQEGGRRQRSSTERSTGTASLRRTAKSRAAPAPPVSATFAQSSPAPIYLNEQDLEEEPLDPSHARRGIDPSARNRMNEISIPSLDDQQKERELATTKAGVARWLTTTSTSDVGSPNALPEVNRQSRQVTQELQSNRMPLSLQTDMSNPATPGPGVYVNQEDEEEEEEEEAEDDDDDVESGGEDEICIDGTTPPALYNPRGVAPTPSDAGATQAAPLARKPWTDSPFDPDSNSLRGQPISSNAAIARFERRARETETASVTATIASSARRRSLESMFSAANINIVPPSEADSASISPNTRESRSQRTSLLGRILPKRSPSKNREAERRPSEEHRRKDSSPSRLPVKRVSSWGRAKSPSISSGNLSPPPLSQLPRSATTLAPSSGPWTSMTNVIKRARSRSDLGGTSALAQQWASSGGPPVPNLRPPSQVPEPEPDVGLDRQDSFESRDGRSDLDGDGEQTPTGPVDMFLGPMRYPAAPTPESFEAHTLNANPRIEPYMLDRVTSEQLKRYRRIVEARMRHNLRVDRKQCPSGDLCSVLGSGPRMLEPRRASVESDGPSVTFYINRSGSPSDNAPLDDDSIPASFPEGIPLPPSGVQKLPAEFECPLCFQVKKFLKPSDWTKHVHEDLQPFTCSFPDCGEPKSFKRKADWVRHENERHRQLEKWICNFPDCQHICYRKDNFVQHLVREHKMPEPKMRAPKAPARPGAIDQSQVGQLLEICRYDTPRRPDEEACRFCGNYLTSWKKLSAHLAKHMEHISLPVLSLIRQEELNQGTTMRPSDHDNSQSRRVSAVSASAPIKTEVPRLDTSYGGLLPGPSAQTGLYSHVPTSSTDSGYQGDGAFTPANVYARPRPETLSYPGAKSLQRRPSPFAVEPLAQPVQFVDDQAYAEASPSQTYISVFDDSANILPGTESHGASLTYPPAFMPLASQGQQNPASTHTALYGTEQMYGQSFSSTAYNTQSNAMHQQGYHYPPVSAQTPAMQYPQGATSPYTSDASSRKQSGQFTEMAASQYPSTMHTPSNQYAQGAAAPYSAGSTAFPQIQLEQYSQVTLLGGADGQQQYLSPSPALPAAGQGYLAPVQSFEEQAGGTGHESAPYIQQQQQQQQQQRYGRYYGS